MSLFCDTSFLCSLYRRQEHTPKANAFMAKRGAGVFVSSLLLLEFKQSLRFQVWLHTKDKTKGFPKHQADQMKKDLAADLKAGVLEIVDVDWAAVHKQADNLSESHTEANGHRFADLLHVATALHLGVGEFLTFDGNQRLLAEAEGLSIPV